MMNDKEYDYCLRAMDKICDSLNDDNFEQLWGVITLLSKAIYDKEVSINED